tara:strand:- start:10212 stop:10799 length:588 start_codon:yes stop_codon:yes gene_type:complete
MTYDCNDLNPKEVRELFKQYIESNPWKKDFKSQIWFEKNDKLMSHYISQFDMDLWPENILNSFNNFGILASKNVNLSYSLNTNNLSSTNFPVITEGVYITKDYRGFFLNQDWLFYQGNTYSIYFAFNGGEMSLGARHYDSNYDWGGGRVMEGWKGREYEKFISPNMLDITTLICKQKPENSFLNWVENPFEGWLN